MPSADSPWGVALTCAEEAALRSGATALVLRTGLLFGPADPAGRAQGRSPGGAFESIAQMCRGSVSYLPDVADAMLDLLIDEEAGIWHLVNDRVRSNSEPGRGAAADDDGGRLMPHEVSLQARGTEGTPLRQLDTVRGRLMPKLDRALELYARDLTREPTTFMQPPLAVGV